MKEPSVRYFDALQRTQDHHKKKMGKTFSGAFMFKRRFVIKDLMTRYGVESMLDYGCGYGKQYVMLDNQSGRSLVDLYGFMPTVYDPGVTQFSVEPNTTFDMVCCVQVLNCIPSVDLPWVVDRLYGYADKVIFISERLGVPRKPVHEDMRSEMPHGWSIKQWLKVLRRPGSGIALHAEFGTGDGWIVKGQADEE
jgi:hypothetical protein